MGEERERIPGLVSWRGQQQDWRQVKVSAWALLPLRAGRDGCGAPAGYFSSHPALVTAQPSAGHQHWDRD